MPAGERETETERKRKRERKVVGRWDRKKIKTIKRSSV